MRQECRVTVHEDNELTTIEVMGNLTAAAEEAMDTAYQQACRHNTRKILTKFDGESRINSAGVAIMIDLVMESREKRIQIFVSGLSNQSQKIFELVGLTKYVTIVTSEEEVRGS